MGEEQEVAEQEGPELLVAFRLPYTSAVQKLARTQAVRQRVKDQVLEKRVIYNNTSSCVTTCCRDMLL